MALNIKGGPPPIKTGVSYTQHLGKAKPIVGMTSTEHSIAGKPVAGGVAESKTLNPGVFTEGMSIMVGGGRTLNLGNYESARVDVHITVPCEKNSLDAAYDFATTWVSERIEEAVKLAKGGE